MLRHIIKKNGHLYGRVYNLNYLVRTILEAIVGYFPLDEKFKAIGSLKLSNSSREMLAMDSIRYICDQCG